MNNKKRGSNCAGSALVIGMIVMAVLVVGSGVGLGVKTGLDTRKWNNLSQAVDSYGISYFSNQKENLGERWEDTGIFDFSERKDILEQMEKLEGSARRRIPGLLRKPPGFRQLRNKRKIIICPTDTPITRAIWKAAWRPWKAAIMRRQGS